MSDLSLLERARNMIAALQWSGVEVQYGGCETCGPDKEDVCPLCGKWERTFDSKSGKFDRPGTHYKDCELWALLKDLNKELGGE